MVSGAELKIEEPRDRVKERRNKYSKQVEERFLRAALSKMINLTSKGKNTFWVEEMFAHSHMEDLFVFPVHAVQEA